MTSMFGPEGQIDLTIGETHRLVIINHHTKFHQNRRWSCNLFIDLTWNAPMYKYMLITKEGT